MARHVLDIDVINLATLSLYVTSYVKNLAQLITTTEHYVGGKSAIKNVVLGVECHAINGFH